MQSSVISSNVCLKHIPSLFSAFLSFSFSQKLGIKLQIFRRVTRFLFDQALARKFIALHFLLDLPIRQVLSRFINDFNAELQFKAEEKVGQIMTKLGAEKSNNHRFKQSICWDSVPTLTYVPSFVPDVLFDLIGQSAIWRSVLSSRFNKIQTHKTVTIYTVYLLLRILSILSVSTSQNIADTKCISCSVYC